MAASCKNCGLYALLNFGRFTNGKNYFPEWQEKRRGGRGNPSRSPSGSSSGWLQELPGKNESLHFPRVGQPERSTSFPSTCWSLKSPFTPVRVSFRLESASRRAFLPCVGPPDLTTFNENFSTGPTRVRSDFSGSIIQTVIGRSGHSSVIFRHSSATTMVKRELSPRSYAERLFITQPSDGELPLHPIDLREKGLSCLTIRHFRRSRILLVTRKSHPLFQILLGELLRSLKPGKEERRGVDPGNSNPEPHDCQYHAN